MASWELLDEKGESELHKSRLLNVEEKPFKRITKRLASISAIVSGAATTLKNGNDTKIDNNNNNNNNGAKPGAGGSSALQEDLTLDFAAFDSSIARLQFLHDANARERERYEADKQRILGECQAARDSNVRLREQLEGARRTLAQRKRFDELAEKILSNRMLRPREDQAAALAKLEDECRELERESETYSGTWRERRDQFNRIMEEGMLLRRQIRDEKEEVDRREGMNEDAGADDDADEARGGGSGGGGAATPGLDLTTGSTPRPDDQQPQQQQQQPSRLAAHLAHGNNGRDTPSRDSVGPEGGSLRVPTSHPGGSRASTREPSAPPPETSGTASDEDVPMDEEEEQHRRGDKMELDA